MKGAHFTLLVAFCLGLSGCNRSSSPQATIPKVNAPSFSPQTFITVAGKDRITLVSPTECEVSGGSDILLAQYSRQADTLRMVFNAMGTSVVKYYDVTQGGLRDSRTGQLFLTPELAAAERQRLQKEAEERERAAITARKAEQDAARDRLAALEAKRLEALNEMESRLLKMVVNKQNIQARFDGEKTYNISVRGDLMRYKENETIILSAPIAFSPRPGPDGKVRTYNYFPETEEVPGSFNIRLSPATLEVMLDVRMRVYPGNDDRESDFKAIYQGEPEITLHCGTSSLQLILK